MASPHFVCQSEEEIQKIVKNVELRDSVTFMRQRSRKTVNFSELQDTGKYNIRFKDVGHPESKGALIECDGTPFIILNSEVLLCHQGPVRKKKKTVARDHTYSASTRQIIQNTKKQDCPASVRIRRVVKFPDYKIDGVITAWKKKKKSKELKSEFSAEHTRKELVILVTVQDASVHANHPTGDAAVHFQPLDSQVIEFIHKLALDGHRNVQAIQLLIRDFVNTLNVNSADVEGSRFRPTKENIRSHVYNTVVASNLHSAYDDQTEVLKAVKGWQSSNPEDNFFFRPASRREDSGITSMLFVCQTKFQRELLLKYGGEITLMDGTYKTTKYDIPLFQLCVKTNVGFHIVASFFVSRECKQQIAEALEIIKEWNPYWKPAYFMCDFDLREIGALEATFSGSQVLLCDFHRDQAWQKWLTSNGMQKEKESILMELRKIAGATSEEELETSITDMRTCSIYKENEKFRQWLEKKWLQDCKRWVFCYRKHLSNLIMTTNGIEVLHRVFKHNYLKEYGIGKSLMNVASVLVCNFLPDAERNYITNNIKGMASVRQYSEDIPEFLKNRPNKFVSHCLARIPPNVDPIHIENMNPSTFKVKSTKGTEMYFITIEDEVPNCTCKDFGQQNWPCKHILAICLRDGVLGIMKYMKQAHFVLDTCASAEHSTEERIYSRPVFTGMNENVENRIRKECFENLNNIQNGLFMSDDIDLLKTMNSKISELNNFIQERIPSVAGLPLGRKRKRWQRKNLRKDQSQKRKKASHPVQRKNEKQISMVKPVNGIENKRTDIVKLARSDIQQGKFEKALSMLWTAPHGEEEVARVGPYPLTCNSFKFLKTTLSDEVIDAYLHMLSHQIEQCLHINCVVMTAIFTGHTNIHSHLRRENIYRYDYCIGAVNEGGYHWVLMILRPKERQIIYLNPLGEIDVLKQQVLERWYAFLQGRWEAKIDSCHPDKWTLHCPTHSRQIDGLSCGVYVLKFAENYLRKKSLEMKWTKKDLEQERRNIGVHLLLNATMYRDVMNSIRTASTEETGVHQEKVDAKAHLESDEKDINYPESVEEAEIAVEIENDEFEPTPWFQPVKKGQKMPGGLHYKMDLQTGETLAKLVEGTKEYERWEEKQMKNKDSSNIKPIPKMHNEKQVLVEKELEYDDDSEEPEEESFFIDKEIASKNIEVAYSRVDRVIKMKEKNKLWMRRHYQFQKFQRVVGKGYGYAVFSTQAILLVKEKLTKRFFTDVTSKIYTKHGKIIGMKDEEMNKLFQEDKFLAYVYLLEVLVTEGLAAILQQLAGLTYKIADEECRAVEGKSEVQALHAGIILSSEKKKELMRKCKR